MSIVTARMRELIEKAGSGFLGTDDGGQELRDLYRSQSIHFDPLALDPFATACFFGNIDVVIAAITNGTAPPLDGTVSDYKFGYVTLAVSGSQRLQSVGPGPSQALPHAETIDYLLSHGCPPDAPDICGITALAHASMIPSENGPALVRALIRGGAAVDRQDMYGMVPIVMAAMAGHAGAVDALMEAGARIDIPDADGVTPEDIYITCGPEVTAVIRKWLRRRAGTTAPLDDTNCATCGKNSDSGAQLKQCSACFTVRYCSPVCQRNHWTAHKVDCRKFTPDNTIVLKPFYAPATTTLIPTAATARRVFHGIDEQPTPPSHSRSAQRPLSYPKSVIIKIQVALPAGDMLVYTKKRDFVCNLRRQDAPEAFDRLTRVIRVEGTGGLKGYFAANLLKRNELVVKVDQILAEQQF